MIKTLWIVALLGLTASLVAADFNGKWTGQVPGRQGAAREATFTFKVDGDKVTGSMSSQQGDRPISEGKVSGDNITFVVESQRGKQTYTGSASGDEIKFKREGGQGGPQTFTAKRAKNPS